MYFWFSEGLRSINDSTWLQVKLVDSVSHEGSNLAPLTKEESVETSDMYLFFLFDTRLVFYKHSTNNAQTSNEYVGRKGMGLNCLGLLWAEVALGRIDQ